MTGAHDTEARGIAALEAILPPPKAELVRRLWGAGSTPSESDFRRNGLMLTQGERADLDRWLDGGMATRVVEEVRARDGAIRLGIGLRDGRRVETVAMPVGAVCVSTQVGCAVGCVFCACGVERNLDPDEILEQVIHARRRMRTSRVVFMGMGEPTHNLEAVLAAVVKIKEIARIGPSRQTVSTVGSTRAFERMARAEVPPALTLSLHAADDALRERLLPRAPKERVADLIAAADAYGRAVGVPVQLAWTVLEGINDRDEDIDALCALLRGVRGCVNFIVWNPVDGMPFRSPPRARMVAMVRRVKEGGVLATIRDSAGPDAEAACGQLRLRSLTPRA
jgi:23S rRNA (adenine2503-C2)-methyltransferase